MTIKDDLLSINQYSRWGKPIVSVRALVIHWLANPGQSAKACRDFFESRKYGGTGYGSAHYIIDGSGLIIRCIPEGESAFHVGSTMPDPVSGKPYTNLAREKFGVYATDYVHSSPNSVTLGIEHCHLDWDGTMTDATMEASIELAADICKRHNLDPDKDILLHKEVVGWKDCHMYFVRNPCAWTDYKARVRERIGR